MVRRKNTTPFTEENLDLDHEEYSWGKGKVRTKIWQDNGVDLCITQGEGNSVCYYGDQGTLLFAALLNYYHRMHQRLPHKDPSLVFFPDSINFITARQGTFVSYAREGSSINDFEVQAAHHFLERTLPSMTKDDVILDDTTTRNITGIFPFSEMLYFPFLGEDDFIVGIFSRKISPDKSRFQVKMKTLDDSFIHPFGSSGAWDYGPRFSKEDALRLLRGIYYFAPMKETLDRVYDEATRILGGSR